MGRELMLLREEMTKCYDQWAESIPKAWHETFRGVTPDKTGHALGGPLGDLQLPTFPPLQASEDEHHCFRAFQTIAPEQVQLIVVGQDPYPNRIQATGRAFEQGSIVQSQVSPSLKRLLQSGIACSRPAYQNRDTQYLEWSLIREEMNDYFDSQDKMTRYFNNLARQGVLSVNAAWTISAVEDVGVEHGILDLKGKVQKVHRDFWRPVMQRLIEKQAEREACTVFLFFGGAARDLLCGLDGVWRNSALVQHDHPSSRGLYFAKPHRNPFALANEFLVKLGGDPIDWSP